MPGDLKIAITSIAPTTTTNPFGLGPLRSIYVTVTNIGNAACPLFMPSSNGFSGTTRVTFSASSVGPMASSLAPGQSHQFILQNPSREAQDAIYNGTLNVTTSFAGEVNTANDMATASKLVITNPR